jgi:hypothetical protein
MNNVLSKLGEWIGAFLLRSLLLIGAIVVFSNGIYMSWNHTHEFATISGMTGSLATSYTMFVEVILGVSEIVIIFYSFLETRIPKAVIWGFGFGLIINLIGNVSSLVNYGGWGIFTGVSITAGTIIASAIFASALVQQNEKNGQTDKTVRTPSNSSDTQTLSDSDMMMDSQTTDTFGHSNSPLRVVRTIKMKVSKRTDRRYFFRGHLLGQMETDILDKNLSDTQTLGQVESDDSDSSVRAEETDTFHDSDSSDNITFQTIPDTLDTRTVVQTDMESDKKTDTLEISDTSDTTIGHTLSTDNGQHTQRTKIANRINHLLDEEDTFDDDDHVYNTAIQYIKENGKRPSIRGLADLAGVKKNKAEKAMKKIKAEQIA